MNNEEIVLSNEKNGIKTVFFNEDNGLLGYTENGVIYLNEFYGEDLELINKHETLHLFEKSKQFLGAKKIIFDMLGEKELRRLRNEYYLKYCGLYTEEDINGGILDNEIAIDIIIGNGLFSFYVDDYIDNAYEAIVLQKESIKLTEGGRRYLSLNVSRNTSNRYSQLNKWDLLFAGVYYEGLEKPVGENRYEIISGDATSAFDDLLCGTSYFDFCICTEKNPYLERRLNEIIATYKAKGDFEAVEDLLANKFASLDALSSEYTKNISSQFAALSKLLRESDYEDSFKYLVLYEVLTKTYCYEHGNRIVDKRETGKTILPLMLINEFILKEIHDNVDKYHSFTDLYFDALDKYNNEFLKSKNANFNSSELGTWIKFNKGEEGTSSFIKDSQNLRNLIRYTPWCTKRGTEEQLKQGDFYVFVDNYGKPRIAVQFKDNYINEVRGIKGGVDQELEGEYRQTAIDFLQENISIEGASVWLEKEQRNQMLEDFLVKIRTNTLEDRDIENLVRILDMREVMVHGDINSNERKLVKEISKNKEIREKIFKYSGQARKVVGLIEEMVINERILECKKKIENGTLKLEECSELYDDLFYEFDNWEYSQNQKDLIETLNSNDNSFKQFIANKYGYKPNEIYIGRLEKNGIPLENGVCPIKVVIGDVELISLKNIDLSNLELIKGSLEMTACNSVDISSLVQVDGNVDLADNRFINMTSLEFINGNLKSFIFTDSDMSNIKKINGDALFGFFGGIEEYKNLEEVNGNLQLSHITKKMDKLRFVKGVLEWEKLCEIKDFPSLEYCGGFDGVPYTIEEKFSYDEDNCCYIKNELKR